MWHMDVFVCLIQCCSLTLQDDSDGVWSEALSSRTQRLVFGCNTQHRHILARNNNTTPKITVRVVLLRDLTVMV